MTFEEFVAGRLDALIRYATVVTWDPHLAEDITQEVLARAQARWGRIGRLDAPEPYVKRMVVNEFLSWRRRRAAQLVFLPRETLEGMTPPLSDGTGVVDDRDVARRLIAGLPPKHRAAIALRCYEDLSDEQIAAVLGCRAGTVRSYLSRGLATLRAAMPAERARNLRGVPVTSDIDDVIREAVRRQERLAPPAELVRAALPTRAARYARRRRTTAGLAVAAAAVTAVTIALTVPVVLREPGGGGAPAPPTLASGTGSDSAAPGLGSAPLRFVPTWLPEGWVERHRAVPLIPASSPKTAVLSRVWTNGPLEREDEFVGASPNIGLYAWPAQPNPGASQPPPVLLDENGRPARGASAGQEVDINGQRGTYDGAATVNWQVGETKLMLVAAGAGLSEADLLKIARSVRPDSAVVRSPLRLGWLPDGIVTQKLAMAGNSANAWEATLVAEQKTGPADYGRRYVTALLGTEERNGGLGGPGERLEIDGHHARLFRADGQVVFRGVYRAEWVLVVDLGAGRWLTLQGGTGPTAGSATPPTRENMIRIAEHVELAAEPDLAWFTD